SAEYAAKGIGVHLASRSGKVGLHPAQRSARGRGRVSPRLHQLDRRHASVFVGAAQVRQRALRQTVGVNNALAVGLAKIGAAVNLLPAANETGACERERVLPLRFLLLLRQLAEVHVALGVEVVVVLRLTLRGIERSIGLGDTTLDRRQPLVFLPLLLPGNPGARTTAATHQSTSASAPGMCRPKNATSRPS